MASAVRVLGQARFRASWGADANLLRTPQDVEDAASAGFTYYTIDPSEYVRAGVDALERTEVERALATLVEDGTLTEEWQQPYVDRTIELTGSQRLALTLEPLQRAAVRYARAIRHCARMSEAIARANQGRPYETEAFFAAMPGEATALEHLFIGLELEARGVRLTSLALRLVGPDDAASILAGQAEAVEARLHEHAAVAQFCGPYKLSFHHVSFLPSLYPLLGHCCGDALHLKSRHLSFLEAMRVVHRTEPGLYEEVARFAATRSSQTGEAFAQAVNHDPESDWLVGAAVDGSLEDAASLTAVSTHDGRPFRDLVAECLEQHAEIYREQLTALFDKRLILLKAG